MSILKSTNSGKKQYWHVQLKRIAAKVYELTGKLDNLIYHVTLYYEVPIENSYVGNKILFYKGVPSVDIVILRLIDAFVGSLDVCDNYTIEDINLDNVRIVVEK